MTDTRIRAPRATDLLREDHRRVRKLFDDYAKLRPDALSARERAFERIHQELTIHAQIEEEIFYPAFEEDEAHEDIAALLEEAREAHEEVADLLEELGELDSDDEAFDDKMRALRESVERHAEEEEREIFPFFHEIDEDAQEDVAERLHERRAELAADEES